MMKLKKKNLKIDKKKLESTRLTRQTHDNNHEIEITTQKKKKQTTVNYEV